MASESKAAPELDETDRRILHALQREGRISFAELGRRVGLTAPAVAGRMRRLEAAGVIVGYRAEVDAARVGRPITALIRLRTPSRMYDRVLKALGDMGEVVECHHVSGEDSFVLKAVVTDVAHLEAVIARISAFGDTSTSIVLSSPIAPRPLG